MLNTHEEWMDYLGNAIPTYATKPTPDTENELAKNLIVAKALGTPLMPWQEFVTRVSTEKTEDGRYRYPVVVLTVPRQSGKTTLIRTILTARGLLCKKRKSFYTAQSGKDANARWKDLIAQIEDSVFEKEVKIRTSIGSEGLLFLKTKSSISPFSPTSKSLHGYTPADVVLDEIFAWDDAQGTDLMGAIMPAQQTIKDRQLWLISTAGHAGSTFLNQWTKAGRESLDDPDTNIAYFEWSMPEGLDPFDAASWAFHPAIGHTIEEGALREAAKNIPRGEFVRAYMNRYTPTIDSVFDMDKWDKGKAELVQPDFSKVAIAYQVAQDRSRAAVVAAWKLDDKVCIKVVRSEAGADWVQECILNLKAGKPYIIGADDGGTTRATTDDIRRTNTSNEEIIKALSPKDFGTASVAFKARVEDGRLSHDGDEFLREAMANAKTRPWGESWAFSHKSAPEVIAAVVAVRLIDFTPPKGPKPMYYA